MDKYIYLVAQLPALVFDKPSYMTSARFLEEADKWMGRQGKKEYRKTSNIRTKNQHT